MENTPPEPELFVWRLPLLWLSSTVLISAAVLLAALAMHFHQEYGRAHEAARLSHMSGVIGPSPEPFFQRAGYAVNGIVLVCIVALIATLKTRHPISLAAFVVCIATLVYAMGQVGVRY